MLALIDELGGVDAISGHSFGGKVVMATRAAAPARPIWVLDASPSAAPAIAAAPPPTVVGLLDFMARAPRWPDREAFVQAVVGAGHAEGLARWLAMSLVADPAGGMAGGVAGGMVLRFDVAALRAMLTDYFATDTWAAIAAPGAAVHVVVAERSTTISAADRARLATLPAHVQVHAVDAGHWLHVDAPDRVIDVLARALP